MHSNNADPREGIKTGWMPHLAEQSLHSNNADPREGIKTKKKAGRLLDGIVWIQITLILVRGLKRNHLGDNRAVAPYIQITLILVRGLKLWLRRRGRARFLSFK